jgi:hypothetical protein
VTYQNIQYNLKSEKGAAIQCFGCRKIEIVNSKFKGLRSWVGGAIHITDFPTNKRPEDINGKYLIKGTSFD